MSRFACRSRLRAAGLLNWPVCTACLPKQKAFSRLVLQVGLELDPQYKLPKMRYKGGTPPPQFIRLQGQPGSSGSGGSAGPAAAAGEAGPAVGAAGQAGAGGSSSTAGSKPLIAEVGSDEEEPPAFALLASKRQARQRQAVVVRQQAPAAAAAPQSQQESAPQSVQQSAEQSPAGPVQLQPQMIEYVGKPATEVCVRVQLPASVAAAVQQDPEAISTGVCAETVRVEAPGCAPLEVRLPFAVSAVGGSAEVQAAAAGGCSSGSGSSESGSSGAQLVLRLPYRPFSSVLDELRQAAGAAEGHPSGGGMMDLD